MNSNGRLHYKNMLEGIDEYLKSLGKLVVTPKGPYATIAEAAIATGTYKTTVIRRCKSTKDIYQNWYFIDGVKGINLAEECEYCDQLDDMLFREQCWLENVEDHYHTTPLLGHCTVNYLFKGKAFRVTVQDWVNGLRPHLILNEGEENDNSGCSECSKNEAH